MTGSDLRARRVEAGVLQWHLGVEMGVGATRISQLESLAKVPEPSAQRYLAALARCIAKKESAA